MPTLPRIILRTATALALALTAVPAINLTLSTEAHAGPGGGGGGQGGGQGGGNGGGHGADASANAGNGKGHGSTASELGKMNAAHASDTAMANASKNSVVGAIADYKSAMEAEMDLGASLSEAHSAVAKDFEAARDGISDLSDDAVGSLGSMLGLD